MRKLRRRTTLKLDLAIEFAARAHQNQFRKSSHLPYITHPFAVAMALCRRGYGEKLIISALLHDTVEDGHFGDSVARIVEGCSELDKSLPWEVRKQETLDRLRTASLDIRIVACADKLHNIRSISKAYTEIGDDLWQRFKRGCKDQEWYYRGLVDSFYSHNDFLENHLIFQDFKEHVDKFFNHSDHHLGN
ncbi:HD domain-containing protein [candidate division KSB1 bacterium]|nr:HD domain-containing protein [candidate division KSB1 bacterium]